MTGDSRIPRGPGPLPASAAPKTDSVAPAATGDGKAALRKALLAARAAIDPARKAQWDAAIGARVLAWWRGRSAGADAVLGVYWPLRGEPDLGAAYAELAGTGVRLALPVVLERHAPLAFAWWTPGEPLRKDAMGVAVPLFRTWSRMKWSPNVFIAKTPIFSLTRIDITSWVKLRK